MDEATICDECGKELKIGDFPFCPHGRMEAPLFRERPPYYDHGLDAWITSLGQKRRLMKEANADYRQVGQGMPGCEV
jgi:hypothetical protein